MTLNKAVMSHEIKRQAVTQLNMPMFSFRKEHINKSLAKVAAEDDGAGRVLAYELDASDESPYGTVSEAARLWQ